MREFNYLEPDMELMVPKIMNLVAMIHEYKGKQELFLKTKPDILLTMLEVAKIQSTGASNRIEGIFTSDARLNELVAKKAEPLNRDEAEIAGYREVLNTIHENYDGIRLQSSIILQLHKNLYSFHPFSQGGKYKNQDNVIEEIDERKNRRIRFRPLSAFETPDAMDRLCVSYHAAINKGEIDSLLLIAKFAMDFLCIHPFNDGNGRMSRLLTLLLLYQEGYIVGKYISLEMGIEQTKQSYYETLEASSAGWHDKTNNQLPFVQYYLCVLLKAYKEFSDRMETVTFRKMNKSDRIRDLFETRVVKLSKREILEIYPDISIPTIEKALSDLLKEGFIRKIGSGRGTGYIKS